MTEPPIAGGELVVVARALNQSEAELLEDLLRAEGVPSLLRRAPGFDVPDFLAAGPREVLVPASLVQLARDVLLQSERPDSAMSDPTDRSKEVTMSSADAMSDTTVDVAALAELLHETSGHHGRFENAAPAHDWWDWYAPYLSARQRGSTPQEADAAADLYMKEVRGVVPR